MSPECAEFAREPAKFEDQVRFLAATLTSSGSDVVWTSGAPIHPLRIWIGVFRTWIMTRTMSLRLAQRVEHQTINLEVTGSNPVPQPPT
jgi:hypothetical protein